MSEQASLFESPHEARAAAMAEAHRAGRFYVEPSVSLPPSQATVPATHRARATDPRSSREAAEEVTTTGRADHECAIVLAALREFPGTTSKELAERARLDYHLVARRLPDLRDTYFQAQNGADRICTAPGSSQRRAVMTWLPVNPYAPNGKPSNP